MNQKIVTKIRKIRKEKGFTQLQMAEYLNIDASAYARLETGTTFTRAKYLEEILSIFELTPEKFFEGTASNIIITNQQGFCGDNAHVEHLHAEDKEIYLKLIERPEQENVHLKSEIDFLRKLSSKI